MAKKSTSSKTENTTSNVVATPTNPEWVTGGLAGLGSLFTGLAQKDPQSLVAGPNANLMQAGQAAGSLQTSPLYGQAADIFSRIAGQGANTYNPTMGSASTFGGAKLGEAPQFGGTQLGPASLYGGTTAGPATTYGGTNVDPARQFGGTDAGSAAQYGGTNVGEASLFGGAKLGPASLIGDVPQVQSQSLLDNLSAYMSPYTNDVVKTTLAGFDDNSGRVRAAQALDLANDATFGGSGGSILRSLTEGQLGLGRAQTEAQLRDSAFQTGANLSGQDATRRQSASSENASSALQRLLANQGAQNSFSLAQGGFDQQAGLAGMDAQNAMRQLQASLNQQTGLANTGAVNDRSALQAGLNQQTGLANTQAQNEAQLLQSQLGQQTGLANMGALNDRSALQAGLTQQTGLANTDAQNQAQQLQAQLSQQTGLANQGVLADFLKTQGGFDQQTGLANMDANNQFGLANMGAMNEAGRYNAGAADTAAARGLTAASGLGSLGQAQGADARANIEAQSQIGQILQQIQQMQAGAPMSQASILSQLWGGLPLDLLKGVNTNSTGTGTTKGKTTELGMDGADIAKIAAAAIMASDRRLKHSVKRIDREPNGLNVYEFSYHGSNDRYVGYMADEVAKVKPDAVVTMPNGYLAVNYGAL